MKLHSINTTFSHGKGSCDKHDPSFEWVYNTPEKGEPLVVVDNQISITDQLDGYTLYAWLCESKEICFSAKEYLQNNLDYLCDRYERIFTCDHSLIELHEKIEYVPNGSNKPWVREEPKEKTKIASVVTSGKNQTSGHKMRNHWVESNKNNVDVYGRLYNPIDTKETAMLPYYFSVVFENSNYDKYYTEKITDCFASKTIPVYWGTRLVTEDFNADGILFIEDQQQLKLTPDLYYSKMNAIEENYQRVKELKCADDILYEKIIGDKL